MLNDLVFQKSAHYLQIDRYIDNVRDKRKTESDKEVHQSLFYFNNALGIFKTYIMIYFINSHHIQV